MIVVAITHVTDCNQNCAEPVCNAPVCYDVLPLVMHSNESCILHTHTHTAVVIHILMRAADIKSSKCKKMYFAGCVLQQLIESNKWYSIISIPEQHSLCSANMCSSSVLMQITAVNDDFPMRLYILQYICVQREREREPIKQISLTFML